MFFFFSIRESKRKNKKIDKNEEDFFQNDQFFFLFHGARTIKQQLDLFFIGFEHMFILFFRGTDDELLIYTTSKDDEDKVAAYNKNIAGYIVKEKIQNSFEDLVMLLDFYWRIVELPEQ